MTVSATFELPGKKRLRPELPVCTARVFREIIGPIAERLGLALIASWDTMSEINFNEHLNFVHQLRSLIEEIATTADVSDDEKSFVKDRISTLIENVLYSFEKSQDLVITIG